jgi:hypothetical protein
MRQQAALYCACERSLNLPPALTLLLLAAGACCHNVMTTRTALHIQPRTIHFIALPDPSKVSWYAASDLNHNLASATWHHRHIQAAVLPEQY